MVGGKPILIILVLVVFFPPLISFRSLLIIIGMQQLYIISYMCA